MTGGVGSPAPGAESFTIWARHSAVVVRGERPWMVIRTGLTGPDAVAELTRRQDVLRRRDEPCRLIVLPDGKEPT